MPQPQCVPVAGFDPSRAWKYHTQVISHALRQDNALPVQLLLPPASKPSSVIGHAAPTVCPPGLRMATRELPFSSAASAGAGAGGAVRNAADASTELSEDAHTLIVYTSLSPASILTPAIARRNLFAVTLIVFQVVLVFGILTGISVFEIRPSEDDGGVPMDFALRPPSEEEVQTAPRRRGVLLSAPAKSGGRGGEPVETGRSGAVGVSAVAATSSSVPELPVITALGGLAGQPSPCPQQEWLYLTLLALHAVYGIGVHRNSSLALKMYSVLLTLHFFLVAVLAVPNGSLLDVCVAALSVPLVLHSERVSELLVPHVFTLRK